MRARWIDEARVNRRHFIENALPLTGLALASTLFEGCSKQATLAGNLNN